MSDKLNPLYRMFRSLRDAWLAAAIRRAENKLLRKVKLEPWIDTTAAPQTRTVTKPGLTPSNPIRVDMNPEDAAKVKETLSTIAEQAKHARINITRDDE